MRRRYAQFLQFLWRQLRGGPLLLKQGAVYYIPLWLPAALLLCVAAALIWHSASPTLQRLWQPISQLLQPQAELAPFFAPSVQHWSGRIQGWADQHALDPQLLATVMQIESCGHPTAVSSAGARGLFQVMPFHFEDGEDPFDPHTNARRGGSFLSYCQELAGGAVGETLACYNGGPAIFSRPKERWSAETQQYFRWGVGIYSEAIAQHSTSPTLTQWLAAGGQHLCTQAQTELGIPAP